MALVLKLRVLKIRIPMCTSRCISCLTHNRKILWRLSSPPPLSIAAIGYVSGNWQKRTQEKIIWSTFRLDYDHWSNCPRIRNCVLYDCEALFSVMWSVWIKLIERRLYIFIWSGTGCVSRTAVHPFWIWVEMKDQKVAESLIWLILHFCMDKLDSATIFKHWFSAFIYYVNWHF